jgi:hypothetical protein
MALNKQPFNIQFSQGIDTKTDKKQTVAGRLHELENGVFTKLGAISKRYGNVALGNQLLDSTDITEGNALSVFKDELTMFTGNEMYSYSSANDKWADKGRVVSALVTSRRVIQNSTEQSVPAVATNQGVTVYAFEDSAGGIRVSAIDQETGNYLIANEQISTTGVKPKCVSLNRTVYIFYIEATVLKFKKINTSDPTTITSSVNFATDLDGVYTHYDALVVGSRIFVAWNNNNASSAVALQYMTSTEIFSVISEYTSQEAQTCITLISDESQNVWVAWHNGSAVKGFIQNYALDTEVLAVTTIETVGSVCNITGVVSGSTATWWYEVSAGSTYNHLVRTNTLTSAGVVGTAALFLRSVGLASKAFTYNSAPYLVVAYESTLQSTYIVVNANGEATCKISHQIGGGLTDKPILPEVPAYDTGIYLLASQIKGKLESANENVFTLNGINSTVLDFVSNNRFQSATLGDNLHIAGGVLNAYDGNTIVEHGFNFFPENITASGVNSGGALADGTYQVSVLFEWTDNYGQIHRSAASVAQSVVISGGAGSAKIAMTIPTLRLTRKTGVNVVIYVTELNGTTFYRSNSISSPLANSTTVDTVSYNVTTVSGITANELLYTNGGVLDNIAAPACTLLTEYNNRLVYVPSENDNTFGLTKERQDGDPVNFTDAFIYRLEAKGGGIGALGVLDEKLILFKKNTGIYWCTGNGPTDLGTDDDITKPQPLPTDVNCDNPNSVVLTPAGLMFSSAKGIYMLDRSMQTSYIGAPVEDFNSLTITSSSLVPDTNQVRFITNDGVCLVFDYLFSQWSTFTNHEAEDCVIWDNRFVFLKSNGKVLKESPGIFTDDNLPIKMKLTTSWLSIAGIQGVSASLPVAIAG